MTVKEFNWLSTNKEEIEKMITNMENSELEELGIDTEEERNNYIEALNEMLKETETEETYEDFMADRWHEEYKLGL